MAVYRGKYDTYFQLIAVYDYMLQVPQVRTLKFSPASKARQTESSFWEGADGG